ncbi:hydrogen peroxide-dependent heme synthase [Corynebacterium suicordis]|uniref:Coproheme decarboxylase n=1 Tax=Corynebacterium suicordis DSM 45110 TaxID=1121369 RepID=A0ABR9ZJ86_9CORY|nr:hydrogen peroxide-dependent heme synthase [Corynebacterium suicordis]MBF4553505.1 chlorite dismutase family protein [Corynebacterium suicordis DSM 45110]MDR6277521.1 chlorite dismutase [Corynebacterium suicordis]
MTEQNTEQIEKLNSVVRYAMYSVFKVEQGFLEDNREEIAAEFQEFLDSFADQDLEIRGVYDLGGLRAEADIMFWWHAEKMEDLQEAYRRFLRETTLGQNCEPVWSNAGLHRPSEFNRSHLPSFIMGEEPEKWICVYPFVRSYDWYVLEPAERSKMLRDHGMQAIDFKDVRANTISAFALGDYEWLLAFEAPELDRIVQLMHKMRYTEARLHVREEVPFFTGRRINGSAEDVQNFVKSLA